MAPVGGDLDQRGQDEGAFVKAGMGQPHRSEITLESLHRQDVEVQGARPPALPSLTAKTRLHLSEHIVKLPRAELPRVKLHRRVVEVRLIAANRPRWRSPNSRDSAYVKIRLP